MRFDEETEQSIDEFIEEVTEARREENLVFYEGCTVVTAPTGAPPEYITVRVDGINDPNVAWRGVPPTLNVGDEVLVWENPLSHRREIWGGSGVAGSHFLHDHHDAATGGPNLNPERISARVLLCGPGLPNATLGAAVARVNALGPPALNSEWTIKVMGRTAEAGNVGIPAYVDVEAHGEESVIGMGANRLTMPATHASLRNLRVTGTTAGWQGIVYVPGADSTVILRDVHVVQSTANGVALCVDEDSSPQLYDVTGEGTDINILAFYTYALTTGGNPHFFRCRSLFSATGGTGFVFDGPVTGYMQGCRAVDTTNIALGLYLDNGADVTTEHCAFRATAAGDDVETLAASTWQHIGVRFDPDNSTLAGIEIPLVTGKANFDDIAYFENGITFDGGTGTNIVTVPDNLAQALNVVDAGGLEYARIVSTDANPYLCLFSAGGGNVGIGTLGPSYPLHVVGQSYVTTQLGVGTAPNAVVGIGNAITLTNIGGYGVSSTLTMSVTANGAYTDIIFFANPTITIAAGKTNSSYLAGFRTDAYRTVGAADAGTLSLLYGIRTSVGNVDTHANALTSNVYGVYIVTYGMTGTIANLYGLYIADTGAGGTINNEWAMYIANDALSYFVGTVSAQDFIDRSPAFAGDAIPIIRSIAAEPGSVDAKGWGKTDHATLPDGMRRTVTQMRWVNKKTQEILPEGTFVDPDTKEYEQKPFVVPGRSLSSNIALNTRAIQQLIERVEYLEGRIGK